MKIFAGGSGRRGRRPARSATHRSRAQGDQELQVTREWRAIGALGAEPIALIQPPARVWRRVAGSS